MTGMATAPTIEVRAEAFATMLRGMAGQYLIPAGPDETRAPIGESRRVARAPLYRELGRTRADLLRAVARALDVQPARGQFETRERILRKLETDLRDAPTSQAGR